MKGLNGIIIRVSGVRVPPPLLVCGVAPDRAQSPVHNHRYLKTVSGDTMGSCQDGHALNRSTLLLLVLLSPLLVSVSARADEPVKPATHGILIPAYFYPAGKGLKDWERLFQAAKRTNIIAIANPNNGPGDKNNPDYRRVIRRASAARVRVVGYVSTRYGKRATAEVVRDIECWYRWYPEIAGIFLDEQASDARQVKKTCRHFHVYATRFVNVSFSATCRPAALLVIKPNREAGQGS